MLYIHEKNQHPTNKSKIHNLKYYNEKLILMNMYAASMALKKNLMHAQISHQ